MILHGTPQVVHRDVGLDVAPGRLLRRQRFRGCLGNDRPELAHRDRDVAPPASESPSSGGGGETEVEAEDSPLGTILVDQEGNTLYVFLQDTGDTSTCTGDCATTWPALIAKGEVKAGGGGGVDESLLGTSARDDGTMQVTYNGHPLYYFSGDQASGDTNGQGIGDIWFVVSPAGDAIKG